VKKLMNTPFRVMMVDPQTPEQLAWMQALAEPYGILLNAPHSREEAELLPMLAQAEGLITQHTEITTDLLRAAPDLKVIQKMGGRRDHLDMEAIRARGIKIALMPLPGSMAVAEHAMALMLACGKKLIDAHRLTVSGAYRELGIEPKTTTERSHGFQWMKIPNLVEFSGLTMGIFGFGDIGTEIAKRAKAFDMEIIYHKRSRLEDDLERELDVTYVDKQDLLRKSDVFVMISPLTPETENAVGAAELAQMKSTAILINVSRGGVIDEEALAAALREKKIAAAGLDVFVREPVPFDHPYLVLDNVVLSPHIAGGKGGGRERQAHAVLANLKRYMDDQKMKHEISG
jgi:glyoxylate reductase